jgi:asparagine synthase (glutamine-hydrolysing)
MRLAVPVSAWFQGALAGEARALAGGSALARTGWFDMPRIARIAEQHRSGSADHGQLLWQLLMLDRSMEHLFGLR